jgi:hypothetical protein
MSTHVDDRTSKRDRFRRWMFLSFIVVVREYLQAGLHGTDMDLSILGPSPFHGEISSWTPQIRT